MKSSGLILLDKKAGVTSFEALGDVKRALGTGKVGHTGTLDKFASGLLAVLVGGSLKLAPWFSHCDKQYRGTLRFGVETDTLDPEGSVTAEAAPPARERVEQALSQFTGVIMQEPPAYSAVHINGQRASSLARSGQSPEMEKRQVSIYKLELCCWDPPFAEIFVHCSSGTYIRSLSRDIALAVESRAHLCSLVRTQVAGFTLEMIRNGECGAWSGEGDGKALQPSPFPINKTVIGLLGLPWFEITPSEAENILHGKPLAPVLDGKPLLSHNKSFTGTASDFSAAVFSEETLIAVVEQAAGRWKYGCVHNSSG